MLRLACPVIAIFCHVSSLMWFYQSVFSISGFQIYVQSAKNIVYNPEVMSRLTDSMTVTFVAYFVTFDRHLFDLRFQLRRWVVSNSFIFKKKGVVVRRSLFGTGGY